MSYNEITENEDNEFLENDDEFTEETYTPEEIERFEQERKERVAALISVERRKFDNVLQLCTDETKIDIFDSECPYSSQTDLSKKRTTFMGTECKEYDFYGLTEGVVVAVTKPKDSKGFSNCMFFKGTIQVDSDSQKIAFTNGALINKTIGNNTEEYTYSIVSNRASYYGDSRRPFIIELGQVNLDYVYADIDLDPDLEFGGADITGEKDENGNFKDFRDNGEDMLTIINNMVHSNVFSEYGDTRVLPHIEKFFDIDLAIGTPSKQELIDAKTRKSEMIAKLQAELDSIQHILENGKEDNHYFHFDKPRTGEFHSLGELNTTVSGVNSEKNIKLYVITNYGDGQIYDFHGVGQKPYDNHLYTEEEKKEKEAEISKNVEWHEVECDEELLRNNERIGILVQGYPPESYGSAEYILEYKLYPLDEIEKHIQGENEEGEYVTSWEYESPLYVSKNREGRDSKEEVAKAVSMEREGDVNQTVTIIAEAMKEVEKEKPSKLPEKQ